MPPSKFKYDISPDASSSGLREDGIESGSIWRTIGKRPTSFKASRPALLQHADPRPRPPLVPRENENADAKRGFRDRRQQVAPAHSTP